MPRKDLEWLLEYKKLTPESTFRLLSGMKPTSKFGEVFQYNNLTASVAGYIGAHVYELAGEPGKAYHRAMEKEIFKPLDMRNTTFDMEKAQHGDFASPHSDDIDGHTTLIKMEQNYAVVPFRPAGGVWTSALGDWSHVNNHWGIPIVHHGGSLFGYKSDWMIMPDAGMGALLLTNSDSGGSLLWLLMRRLVEVVHDGRLEAVASVDASASNYRTAAGDWASKLAQHYVSAPLGTITVKKSSDHTIFVFDAAKAAWQPAKTTTAQFHLSTPTRRSAA